ncbi:hypothetical protein PSEUBRA_003423 [Kalmanozyma brasiliensis GHG001]|uniref:uncharacterized protein n=1 Tax=Kalmanozyma brasiliensis (strain GHG001) TaxID=1365824 RepID=UPI002867DF9C|nr:uncharacterized protein PSEUBRA_003423 [Kalmanozyma brasiliensis GHG001]KAF6767240.1 hypothetical protein PSEUBRA_003423 [Kalmanozyma brasiliensis GHG001]
MTVILHRHLVLLISALLSLLCYQASLVRSGATSSSDQGRYVAIVPSNAVETQHSDYATPDSSSSSDSSEYLGSPEPDETALYGAGAFDRSDEILTRSAEVLPDRLHRLGYPSAIVSFFKDASSASRRHYREAIQAQVQENPFRKQFVPLFGMDGMRTYAMPIDDVSTVPWPATAGRYAGRDGVTKAVVLTMLAGPDARQFISLDVNEGRRQHYAMPLTLEDFAHLPTSPALGRYAGTGGKQKILIFSVTHPSPTSLSLFRGPAGEEAPEIVLHGLIGVTHAQSLHRRIALPWFNAHVAVPLRDVLRPV